MVAHASCASKGEIAARRLLIRQVVVPKELAEKGLAPAK